MPYFWTKRFPNLLSAVTATGASASQQVPGNASIQTLRYYIKAAAITTGGTVLIEGSFDGTTWYTITSVAVAATGNTSGVITGPIGKYWRVNLSARTDGTYTVGASVNYQP